MNSGGLGVGSASIILIFAVLCLTVFSLITFYVAENDKALVDAKANAVVSFYEADARAEAILAQIMSSDTLPATINGTSINSEIVQESMMEIIYFMIQISNSSALYVCLSAANDIYDILSWKMVITDEWNIDDTLNVWR